MTRVDVAIFRVRPLKRRENATEELTIIGRRVFPGAGALVTASRTSVPEIIYFRERARVSLISSLDLFASTLRRSCEKERVFRARFVGAVKNGRCDLSLKESNFPRVFSQVPLQSVPKYFDYVSDVVKL